MVEELPEVVDIGEIKLKVDEAFCYTAWGIRYKFRGGSWRVADIVFSKKVDAEEWMERSYLRYENMSGEVVPAKRCLLLDAKGNIKTWVEELG